MTAPGEAGPPDRSVTRVAAYALCTADDRLLLCRIAPTLPLVRLAWDGVRLAFSVELAFEPTP